jgi:hypothetical protein
LSENIPVKFSYGFIEWLTDNYSTIDWFHSSTDPNLLVELLNYSTIRNILTVYFSYSIIYLFNSYTLNYTTILHIEAHPAAAPSILPRTLTLSPSNYKFYIYVKVIPFLFPKCDECTKRYKHDYDSSVIFIHYLILSWTFFRKQKDSIQFCYFQIKPMHWKVHFHSNSN